MNALRRSSFKAMTRLETLEGRITPTATAANPIVGAQVLVHSTTPSTQTGVPDDLTHVLHEYEQIHNVRRADRFLESHPHLEDWLEQLQATEYSVPVTGSGQGESVTGDDPGSTPPGTGGTPSDPAAGTGSAATGDQGQTTSGGGTVASNPAMIAVAGASGSTLKWDHILEGIYNDYEAGQTPASTPEEYISGGEAQVSIKGAYGTVTQLIQYVKTIDPSFAPSAQDSSTDQVVGMVPIADLLDLAGGGTSQAGNAILQSVTSSGRGFER